MFLYSHIQVVEWFDLVSELCRKLVQQQNVYVAIL